MWLLDGFDLHVLESDSSVTFAVDAQMRLIYANQAWSTAAISYGAESISEQWPIGRSILEALSPELRDWYEARFLEVLNKTTPFNHDYLCSTPERQRQFHEFVLPLQSHRPVEQRGLFLVHSLVSEEEHAEQRDFIVSSYADNVGIVHQCSHCRRIKANSPVEQWDWVPALVRQPHPATSHGLCQPCLAQPAVGSSWKPCGLVGLSRLSCTELGIYPDAKRIQKSAICPQGAVPARAEYRKGKSAGVSRLSVNFYWDMEIWQSHFLPCFSVLRSTMKSGQEKVICLWSGDLDCLL